MSGGTKVRAWDRGGMDRPDPDLLGSLPGRFGHAVIAFTDPDGYPVSVATSFEVRPADGLIVLKAVAGEEVTPPHGHQVNVVFSHIRPQPGYGYDERDYVSMWGEIRRGPGHLTFRPERCQRWGEHEMSFFEYNERGVAQARSYMDDLSRELGRPVRPRLAFGWLFLRATRLPFLSATVVPVGVGISVAALHGQWRWWLGVLTIVAAAFVHLGLNVANDVFDTASGADEANVTPTQFSGGSRVIHYGLLTAGQMRTMSAAFYAVGLGIGLYLAAVTAFWALAAIGVIGTFISYFYTAPPLRLVHRGIGEAAVFLGFGPVMALGAYMVQSQRFSWEPVYASLPVGILVAIILYVNEIPDRPGDAAAGKRTLPVRWSKEAVLLGYDLAVTAAALLIVIGVATGVMPVPLILSLAGFPLALKVRRGLRAHYDSPYELMPFMGTNIQLHAAVGMLMIVGYGISIAVAHLVHSPPGLLV